MDRRTKRKLVIGFQKRVLNPIAKIAPGVVGSGMVETTGRTTGRKRKQPVGISSHDGAFWIVSEHGRSNYVRNLERDPNVRVRYRGKWHEGVATVLPDEDPRPHARGLNGAIVKLVGTELLAIRIDPRPS